MKTPIANILLYGELLAERLEGEDQDLARHLLSETKQLEFLIQSLIKVSRLEADVIQVLPEVQPVLPLLEDIEERGHKKTDFPGDYIGKGRMERQCLRLLR